MSSDFFGLEWDNLDDMERYFDELESRFMDVMQDEYRKYGMLLEEGSKALAPEADGDLAASINFSGLRVSGVEVSGDVGTNMVYALRRHEEPYRTGKFPKYSRGAKFPTYYQNGRGATTRAKGTWRGYPAGRKYMQNAIAALESYYDEMLQRIVDRALNGG